MRIFFLALIILAVFAAGTEAKMFTQTVEYKDGDIVCKGYLAYDDAIQGRRPGVIVVHEWWGLNDYAKQKTEQVAREGYIGFAIDMYGKGITTTERAKAAELSGQFKGKSLMGQRALAGKMAFLFAAKKFVDPERIAVIGFCFGGTTALQLAYTGTDLKGAVCFHGSLPAPPPDRMADMKAKILVLHGADDPYVKQEEITQFQEAMRKGKFDWQMNMYGNAVHSFTNPAAGNSNASGAAYNEAAAKRSWAAMLLFLREIF